MKTRNSFLFALILVSSTALGQGNRMAKAIIAVLADSSAGETMYLTRFHAAGLDYDLLDSAIVTDQPVLFTVTPDPQKEYEIRIGRKYVSYEIYLALGDSLVFQYSPSQRKLVFDRIGANEAFRDSSNRPRSQSDFYQDMGHRDWDGMCNFTAESKKKMETSAAWLNSRFPEHRGIAIALHNAEIRWYYEPRFRYFYKYYDSDDTIDLMDISRLSILDSVPWKDAKFTRGDEIECLADQWLNLKTWYWRRAGRDTAGIKRQRKQFDFALSLPNPARDAAVLSSVSGLNYMKAPEAVLLGEKELKEYKPIASDSGYVYNFEKKLAIIRTKLPGKQAPEFSLPDTTGTLRTLADFRGKIIYVDFWGNWCHPCLEELADLKKLQNKFSQDTSIAFLSIALEASQYKDQNLDAWKKCIIDSGLRGTHLYADDQFQNEYVLLYGIQGVPTFMLIGRDGTFIDAAAPRPSSGKAEDAIRAALARENN